MDMAWHVSACRVLVQKPAAVFMAAEVNEISLGHQPHQRVNDDKILTIGTELVPEALVIFNKLNWLIVQEDFISTGSSFPLLSTLWVSHIISDLVRQQAWKMFLVTPCSWLSLHETDNGVLQISRN
jgi:hypothetical protein